MSNLRYEDFADIVLRSLQNWIIFGVISMHCRVFSKDQCAEWDYFLGVLKFKIYLGVCLIFNFLFIYLFFLGGGGGKQYMCWVQAYVYRRVPPPPPPGPKSS